jgi:transposase
VLYAREGRPSVPSEQLLLASVLQAFYGLRSERLLLEQLHYNLLFCWFVGLNPDDPIWHPPHSPKTANGSSTKR